MKKLDKIIKRLISLELILLVILSLMVVAVADNGDSGENENILNMENISVDDINNTREAEEETSDDLDDDEEKSTEAAGDQDASVKTDEDVSDIENSDSKTADGSENEDESDSTEDTENAKQNEDSEAPDDSKCKHSGTVHSSLDGEIWIVMTSDVEELETGNYYLADDIDLTSGITVASCVTVNLCLNGHIIRCNNLKITVLGTLNIYDCSNEESIDISDIIQITGNGVVNVVNAGAEETADEVNEAEINDSGDPVIQEETEDNEDTEETADEINEAEINDSGDPAIQEETEDNEDTEENADEINEAEINDSGDPAIQEETENNEEAGTEDTTDELAAEPVMALLGENGVNSSYTVSYNLNCTDVTTVPDTQSVESGQKATAPVTPTRDGYVFSGWFKDTEGTVQWDFNSTVTGNITLCAKWTPVKNYVKSGKSFGRYTTATADVTCDSAFSMRFDLTDMPASAYENYTITFNKTLPAGTVIWINNGYSDNYNPAVSGDTVMVGDTVSNCFIIVDFSNVEASSLLDAENALIATLGATLKSGDAYGYAASLSLISPAVTLKQGVTASSFTLASSSYGSFSYTYTAPAGTASKWEGRQLAIELTPTVTLPVDAVIKVGDVIYERTANNNFVLTLATLGNTNINGLTGFSIVTDNAPSEETLYSFTAQLYVAQGCIGNAPMNGDAVASQVTVNAKVAASGDGSVGIRIYNGTQLIKGGGTQTVDVAYEGDSVSWQLNETELSVSMSGGKLVFTVPAETIASVYKLVGTVTKGSETRTATYWFNVIPQDNN